VKATRRVIQWAAPAIAIAIAAVTLWFTFSSAEKPPPVTRPAEFDRLQPQVQEHLRTHLVRAAANPTDADARATLGLALAANELWTDARDTFAAAARIDPDQTLSLYYEAMAAEKIGDHDAALSLLRHLTERVPSFAPAHHRRGELALERGALDEASRAFDLARQWAPKQPAGYVGLADVSLRRRDHEKARGFAEKALRLAPKYPRAHYVLGLAYRGLGREADARKELALGTSYTRKYLPDPWKERMMQHDKSAPGQVMLAMSHARAGKQEQARHVLESALRYHPEDVAVLNNLGVAYLSQRNPRKALELFKKAEKLEPGRADVHLSLGTVYEVLGNLQSALRHTHRAKQLSPHDRRVDNLLRRLRGGGNQ